ncbi:MAG: DUF3127 domain-containing protein [Bacteroidota bacterium]
MDITGTIKVIHKEEKVNDNFTKRVFVITDNSSQYPQIIPFELVKDKCSLIDKFKVGDEVKVHFNIRGREWTSPKGEIKYFTSLNAWRIENVGSAQNVPPSSEPPVETFTSKGEEDDLPF